MNVGFFHDTRLVKDSREERHSIGFPYELWLRYLSVFESLKVVTREITEEHSDLPLSSGAGVEFNGITAYRNKLATVFSYLRIRKQVTAAVTDLDYVIVRLPSVIGSHALRAAQKKNKPTMVELVGCPWDSLIHHSTLGKLAAPWRFLTTRRMVRKATHVLYVTGEFLQKRYPSNGQSSSCSDVVLGVADEGDLQNRLEKLERRASGCRLTLGTVAGVDVQYKGQEYVIRALGKLVAGGVDAEYLLIGGGNQSRLREIAQKYGVAERVHFLGPKPHASVLELLRNRIDLYVQPSLQEGLPRAVVEAMSVGCPVIASRTGGTPELINSRWIYRARDVPGLTALIQKAGTVELQSMAEENFEVARSQFNVESLSSRRKRFMEQFRDGADEM